MTFLARTRTTTAALLAALALSTLTLAGCSAVPESTAAAEKYCLDKGGEVQTRQPTFGTNNDEASWVELGEPIQVCRFQTLDDDAKSRIYVDLVTLSSPKPTLAALAYLAKAPMPDDVTGNPATALCTSLGGASSYGAGANGGGLVTKDDPDDVVFTPCVFADQSFIEEWGIAYYSDGTVRGIDLATVFNFDPSDIPSVF